MVLQGKGRISRRIDGKHFLYLPKSVVEDSAFPFELRSSIPVAVIIDRKEKGLTILPLNRARKPHKKEA